MTQMRRTPSIGYRLPSSQVLFRVKYAMFVVAVAAVVVNDEQMSSSIGADGRRGSNSLCLVSSQMCKGLNVLGDLEPRGPKVQTSTTRREENPSKNSAQRPGARVRVEKSGCAFRMRDSTYRFNYYM
ncbi:hypothetical protein GGR55DRAFT_678606 [Xylaria sp. FL0064]|nr:hypothetical protein GGR55DRAFT_678606 [Xylaria sp. FL0064]